MVGVALARGIPVSPGGVGCDGAVRSLQGWSRGAVRLLNGALNSACATLHTQSQ